MTRLRFRVVEITTYPSPGASIDLQWRLGVAQNGNFRFYIKVEALP